MAPKPLTETWTKAQLKFLAPDPGGGEKEVDKALDYVENIFRKFRDRIRKFEDEDRASPQHQEPPKSNQPEERKGTRL